MPEADLLTLTIGGAAYLGWGAARISRSIRTLAGDFDLEVTERWLDRALPWQIKPFAPCTLSLGNDLVLTGYVDDYLPSIHGANHDVRITGRSATQDLIDCSPDIASGQFSGYTLLAIARAVGALFNLSIVDASSGLAVQTTFADATLERGETAFTFLERLGRLSGVLLSDDPQGRLVLTTVGGTRAGGYLLEGDNIEAARAVLSARRRYSDYIVKGQHGIGGGLDWGGAGGGEPPALTSTVQTQQRAVAHDASVPRYRPRVVLAESMLDAAGMQLRADWMRQYSFGESANAEITVAGWRQADGTLWQPNEMITVTAPSLGLDRDMLVAGVTYLLTPATGRTAVLHLAPPEAFTPDPGQVRMHRTRGARGAADWTGAGS